MEKEKDIILGLDERTTHETVGILPSLNVEKSSSLRKILNRYGTTWIYVDIQKKC